MSNDRRTGTRRPVDRRASARLSAPGRLLAGDDISTADLIAADERIAENFMTLQLATCGEEEADLEPSDFPTAYDPRTCETCQFRKLCWN